VKQVGMAAPRKQDPFYTVKEKVTGSASRVNNDLEQLNSLPAASNDAQAAVVSLKTNLQQMTVDVNDLAQTINIVESNRTKFAAIDDSELNSRKKFVVEMRGKIAQFNDRLNQHANQNSQSNRSQGKSGGKTEKDTPTAAAVGSQPPSANARKQLIGDVNSGRFAGAIAAENKRSTEAVVSNAATQSQLLIDQQDDVLVEMGDALNRLQNIATDINKEMKVQERVMDEAEGEMDEAKNRLDWALKKMDKILKTSDKGRLCCILVLFVACLGLLFGIIWG